MTEKFYGNGNSGESSGGGSSNNMGAAAAMQVRIHPLITLQ
jgi:hypothetical protein